MMIEILRNLRFFDNDVPDPLKQIQKIKGGTTPSVPGVKARRLLTRRFFEDTNFFIENMIIPKLTKNHVKINSKLTPLSNIC